MTAYTLGRISPCRVSCKLWFPEENPHWELSFEANLKFYIFSRFPIVWWEFVLVHKLVSIYHKFNVAVEFDLYPG